jgi:hypothetical protein
VPKVYAWGKEVIAAMEEGDTKRTLFSVLRKLIRFEQDNVIQMRREIADAVYTSNSTQSSRNHNTHPLHRILCGCVEIVKKYVYEKILHNYT